MVMYGYMDGNIMRTSQGYIARIGCKDRMQGQDGNYGIFYD